MTRTRTATAVTIVAFALTAGATCFAGPATSATHTWTITRHRKASDADSLAAVSCVTAVNCVAVGERGYGRPPYVALAPLGEHWSGDHWSDMAMPYPSSDAQIVQARAVDCPAAKSCFAVGTYLTDDNWSKTFAEHWDGKQWTHLRSLNPPPRGRVNTLNAISCPHDNDCFAVGAGNDNRALIEHWNGAHWARMPAAKPTSAATALNGVSCPAVRNCWAVGYLDPANATAVVEHWNGKVWKLVAKPTVAGSQRPQLNDISCPSPKSCFAIGQADDATGNSHPFVQRWDGRSWKVIRTADHRAGLVLRHIACPSTTRCFAVGSNGKGQTLVQRWDRGHPWVAMRSPNDPGESDLYGISCTAPAACFAVGESFTDINNGPYRALMEQYS